MKRINLKGLREVLSEKELKNVMGGSGGGTGGIYVLHECCIQELDGTKSCSTDWGLCAGPDCATCLTYPLAQYGYDCVNLTCSEW